MVLVVALFRFIDDAEGGDTPNGIDPVAMTHALSLCLCYL